MHAADIEKLLSERHAKDIFIPQCKDGPSWGGKFSVLDAWAMTRSWAHPLSIGYEIKVSRNDFLRDAKWQAYLDYCNEFYFVCPPELIQPTELPAEVGLLWTSKNAKMLYCKRKAVRRDIEIPECFYHYILMCRTKIVASTMNHVGDDWKLAYWKNWLSEKEEKQETGQIASKRLRELFDTKVHNAETENIRLQKEIESLKDIRDFCRSIGIERLNWNTEWAAKNKIKELRDGLPKEFCNQVDSVLVSLGKIKEVLAL